MSKKVLVALGGNAILKHKENGTAEEQFENIRKTCKHLARLIKDGYKLAITHGNGPQVGDILLKNERSKDVLPPMPLDICGAQSQGMIGYMLQQSMGNEMAKMKIDTPVVSMITQTLVNKKDVAFKRPTKPIGPFYSAAEAKKLRDERGWTIVDDSGRGYRRVAPSPRPARILEREAIRTLFKSGAIVIAVGGGGVPVVMEEDGHLQGVEAVIDKDLSAQLLATDLGVHVLLMLTDVDRAYINFGKTSQTALTDINTSEAKQYLSEGQFSPGSMAPKIQAAIDFVEAGGEKAVISSLEESRNALKGDAGTTIHCA